MPFPLDGKSPERVIERWDYVYRSASGTLSAATGPVVLGQLIVQGGTLGALVVYDNTAASGTVVANVTGPSGGQQFWFNALCKNGISVFASAATNFTVTYAK